MCEIFVPFSPFIFVSRSSFDNPFLTRAIGAVGHTPSLDQSQRWQKFCFSFRFIKNKPEGELFNPIQKSFYFYWELGKIVFANNRHFWKLFSFSVRKL